MRIHLLLALSLAVTTGLRAQNPSSLISRRIEAEYPSLFELYKHLHANPELSFHEEKTSARVAEELKRAGF